MMRRSVLLGALPRVLLGAPLAAVLAGCGIQPTGAIDAGEPASGTASGTTLFFVLHADLYPTNRQQPVAQLKRPAATPVDKQRLAQLQQARDGTEAALTDLFGGPVREERRAGLTTSIPDGTRVVRVEEFQDRLDVVLAIDPAALPELAAAQITCTVLALPAVPNSDEVVLRGEGGQRREPARCPYRLPRDG